VASLTKDISPTDTVVMLDDVSNISRGIIEIGDELVWVQKIDVSTGTLTLLPKGRGWRGSAATGHTAGDTVTASPVLPRMIARRELANQVNALYPDLFAVKETTFTADNPNATDWPLPDDAESVLDVRYKDTWGNWQRVKQWEVEFSMDTTDFPTGAAVRVTDLPFACTVQVLYGSKPAAPPPGADATSLVEMGLTKGGKDILVNGALARLLPMMDVARLSVTSVSSDEMDQPNPLGSAVQIANHFRDERDKALLREQAALRKRFPARVHRTR